LKRKLNYLFVFLVSLFVFPILASAQCSYERQAELSRIASNVGFSYNYKIQDSIPNFTVNITNVTNDIYVVDDLNNVFVNSYEFNPLYTDQARIIYKIYSNDDNCRGELIFTNYVNFPTFNRFYSSNECKENPDFKLCGLWTDTRYYSTEDFNSELEKYKNIAIVDEKQNDRSLFDQILDFVTNKNEAICLIIFILIFIGVLVFKKVKK